VVQGRTTEGPRGGVSREAVAMEEEYGDVLDRCPNGCWWHLHFGRLSWSYECALLGRNTNVVAGIQKFAAGGVAQSPLFLLDLEGKNLELKDGEKVEWSWMDVELATHFQQEIMPLLHDSRSFQQALARVIAGD